jgi:hypothetical protein
MVRGLGACVGLGSERMEQHVTHAAPSAHDIMRVRAGIGNDHVLHLVRGKPTGNTQR